MDITITPRLLKGEILPPPSKSMAHRLLICAALSDHPTELICPDAGADVAATASCLSALGATIDATESGYRITPIRTPARQAMLHCGESGATLRFLLPLAGALGVEATFRMAGRLPQRPITPLWAEMERMGCTLSRPEPDTIFCRGALRPGHYRMDGSTSSQFITGLHFALSLLPGSTLEITGQVQSAPYLEMTRQAMALFSAPEYHSPGIVRVETDWSNAAFWLCANALGSEISVQALPEAFCQGDRAILQLLPLLEENCTISAADIPDLIPVLSVVAAAKKGATFTDIHRLRLKESDRVAGIVSMITALGGKAEAAENTLTVYGTGLSGGIVDSLHDHRIAMSAAIAATVCHENVTILHGECVQKSYPKFWEEYARLGNKPGRNAYA